jgi:hypothetical protein
MFGGLFFLLKSYIASVGLERIQIIYCFLGIFLTFIPAITFNLIIPSFLGTSRFSHLGPSSTIILLSFFTYAILKHRLMDIHIVLKKGTTYVLLLLLLYAPSFFLVLLTQKIFFRKIDYIFSIILLSIVFIVTISFQKIKPRTERTVEQFFFKNRYDYRETLGKFSKAMVTILDLKSLTKKIIETITLTMGVE